MVKVPIGFFVEAAAGDSARAVGDDIISMKTH
jgi:hypothetical protein